MTDTDRDNYLNYLSVGFYVVGGLTCLFALFPCIHLIMGIAMMFGAFPSESADGQEFPTVLFGIVFTVVPLIIILLGQAFGIVQIMAGRRLKDRRSHTFVLVVSALSCMMVPFGTVIGVLTLVLILQEETKALFTE